MGQSESRAGHQSHGGAAGTSEEELLRFYYASLKRQTKLEKRMRDTVDQVPEESMEDRQAAIAGLSTANVLLWKLLSEHLLKCLEKVNDGILTISLMNMPTTDHEWKRLDRLVGSLPPPPLVVRRTFPDLAVKAASAATVAQAEEMTCGGLLLTGASKDKPSIGTGVVVGPGTLDEAQFCTSSLQGAT